jgi:hypothetical protein
MTWLLKLIQRQKTTMSMINMDDGADGRVYDLFRSQKTQTQFQFRRTKLFISRLRDFKKH